MDTRSTARLCLAASLLAGACLLVAGSPVLTSHPDCPESCNCTVDKALCVNTLTVPRKIPAEVTSLTFIEAEFHKLTTGSFSHLRTVYLLFFKSCIFEKIEDGAFDGMTSLRYLFIELSEIKYLSERAFTGLPSLMYLSLAYNDLSGLPVGLLNGLGSLIYLDVSHNPLVCDCRLKWLVDKLLSEEYFSPPFKCAGPAELQDRLSSKLTQDDFDCIKPEFHAFQSMNAVSMRVDTYKKRTTKQLNVVVAEPEAGVCSILTWDHVEFTFKVYNNITAPSVVACTPVQMETDLFILAAQLYGGTRVFQFDSTKDSFVLSQTIDTVKPSDVETFSIDGTHYVALADGAKGGTSAVYSWNGNRFTLAQELANLYREADFEFFKVEDQPYLLMLSSGQHPALYKWSSGDRQFIYETDIPFEEPVAAHTFVLDNVVYLCLTQFLGESKLLRWNTSTSGFQDYQVFKSRGAMVLQPLQVGQEYYLVLGSDYVLTEVYRWNPQDKKFIKSQDIELKTPRDFKVVTVPPENEDSFLFVASFSEQTEIFRHELVDLSL
ncbi:PREDICTED: leucine-rich glioma-inactivated protein 1-like [Branchiostoma belcheri]|uniref:Leucine-rich glioma-inactivated protein 1-like n=1 Tax=Branchiostoma belcheri TaxID=7741 RepID=A0A6P5A4K8_BRABE|nr:PREDICTED: leucine-rich glioma-inactivated protein 1-like [Branchiostoma belcheri]